MVNNTYLKKILLIYVFFIQGDSQIVSNLFTKNIIILTHLIDTILINSEIFNERVICIAGIKVLNQTLFVNHPVYVPFESIEKR
jgi:phage-related holin